VPYSTTRPTPCWWYSCPLSHPTTRISLPSGDCSRYGWWATSVEGGGNSNGRKLCFYVEY
jgi:hypothetical protein